MGMGWDGDGDDDDDDEDGNGDPSLPFPRRGGEPLRRRLCMLMTTTPSFSLKGRRAFDKKALYDHDPTPFPFLEEEDNFSEEGSV